MGGGGGDLQSTLLPQSPFSIYFPPIPGRAGSKISTSQRLRKAACDIMEIYGVGLRCLVSTDGILVTILASFGVAWPRQTPLDNVWQAKCRINLVHCVKTDLSEPLLQR